MIPRSDLQKPNDDNNVTGANFDKWYDSAAMDVLMNELHTEDALAEGRSRGVIRKILVSAIRAGLASHEGAWDE